MITKAAEKRDDPAEKIEALESDEGWKSSTMIAAEARNTGPP